VIYSTDVILVPETVIVAGRIVRATTSTNCPDIFNSSIKQTINVNSLKSKCSLFILKQQYYKIHYCEISIRYTYLNGKKETG